MGHFKKKGLMFLQTVKLPDRVIGKSFFVYECGFHTDLLFVFHMYSIQRIYRFLRIV